MHWSASIAQLICTILMTIWRAWIRRGLIANPVHRKLVEDHELDWLALRMAKTGNFWPDEKTLGGDPDGSSGHLIWRISTNDNNIACVRSREPRSPAPHSGPHSELDVEKALNIRRRLGKLTGWAGPASALSIAVANSIEIVLNTLFEEGDRTEFIWSLKVEIGDSDHGEIRFKVGRNGTVWKMDATYIEAALSLWLFHIYVNKDDESKKEEEGGEKGESEDDWLRKDKSSKRNIIRLLGPGGSETLRRDIKWWIGDIGNKIYRDKGNEGSDVRQGPGFAGPVGFVGVEPVGTTEAGDNVDSERSGKYHSRRIEIIEQANIIVVPHL